MLRSPPHPENEAPAASEGRPACFEDVQPCEPSCRPCSWSSCPRAGARPGLPMPPGWNSSSRKSGPCWSSTATPAIRSRRRNTTASSCWTAGRRFARAANRGRPSCRASRKKACSSRRSAMTAWKCRPRKRASCPQRVIADLERWVKMGAPTRARRVPPRRLPIRGSKS